MRAVPASSEVAVTLPDGIARHARPAGAFVKTALSFKSQVASLARARLRELAGAITSKTFTNECRTGTIRDFACDEGGEVVMCTVYDGEVAHGLFAVGAS